MVAAAGALDEVLVVAERDRTSRVDLIAAVDAMETTGILPEVVLLDDRTAAQLTARGSGPAVPQPDEPEPAPADEAESAEPEPDEPEPAGPEPASADEPGPHEPDHPEVEAIGRRDVDVLLGAAEAQALAAMESDVPPVHGPVATPRPPAPQPAVPEELDDTRLPAVREPAGPPPVREPVPRALPARPLPGAPVVDVGQAEAGGSEADDDTDELPPVGDAGDARGRVAGPVRDEPTDQDLLRETAQLSILIDELEGRGADRSGRS